MLRTMARDRNFLLGHLIYGAITAVMLTGLLRRRSQGVRQNRPAPPRVEVTAVRM
ncbi:hypothetical protein D3C72_2538280 [compost metagenome]